MLNPHTHRSCGTTSSSGKNTVSLRSTEKAARGNHLGMKNELLSSQTSKIFAPPRLSVEINEVKTR